MKRFYAKPLGVGPEGLQAVASAVARERTVERIVSAATAALAGQPHVALARIWLLGDGDRCADCAMASGCADRRRCLHLVASRGGPVGSTDDWSRLDGGFRRIPLGSGKIGKVGTAGTGMLLHDMSAASTWIAEPVWARREGVRSFAAQPLMALGETLGVVGIFSRARLDSVAFGWLRTIADHTAASVAGARAAAPDEAGRPRAVVNVLDGTSAAVSRLREQIALAGATDAPILVTGERGTGRAFVARRIHEASGRARRPFVRLPATDPVARDVTAAIAAAAGGTVFVDEIAALTPDDQGRLARAVRTGGGAPRAERMNVRLVGATATALAVETDAGRFHRDLYAALGGFTLAVPPLRERTRDVPLLVEHLVGQISERLGLPLPLVAARDLRALQRHAWPGNLRELAAVVEVAVLRSASGRVAFETLLAPAETPDADVVPAIDMRRRERANLEAALARADGRIYGRGGAAELLGVPPTTLASRLKALGVVR